MSTCHAPTPFSPCGLNSWVYYFCLRALQPAGPVSFSPSLFLSLVFPRSPPTWSINTCYRPAGSRPMGERRRERKGRCEKESDNTKNSTPRKRGIRWRKEKTTQVTKKKGNDSSWRRDRETFDLNVWKKKRRDADTVTKRETPMKDVLWLNSIIFCKRELYQPSSAFIRLLNPERRTCWERRDKDGKECSGKTWRLVAWALVLSCLKVL